jgi:hypothetical protein
VWVTATRCAAELLRKVRTGSRHAPGGTACRLSLCVVHRGPKGLQDGPGCATPAIGDPCRGRTCVRCVRGSRPTTGRTGRGCCPAEEEGSNPEASRPHRFSNPDAGHSSSTFPVDGLAGPISNGRPLPSERQRALPLRYGGMAPEARFKLTTGASQAPVLFTTPPRSDTVRRTARDTASDAYWTRTRTFPD